jgi:uncharacterized protein YjbI with pentapeptide repeats
MFVDKSQVSLTLVYLDQVKTHQHRLWVESSHKRGQRISVEGKNLSNTQLGGSQLSSSRFVRCNFRKSYFDYVDFVNAEIKDCIFDETVSYGGTYDKASIRNCQFIKTQCELSHFIDAQVDECDWRDSDCTMTTWNRAKVTDCCFANVEFERSRFHKTHFENCDFTNTRLRAVEAHDTTFKNCDFRHVDLDGFILRKTTFINCGFYGYRNKPDIRDKFFFTNADLSENYDGSQIADERSLIDAWF